MRKGLLNDSYQTIRQRIELFGSNVLKEQKDREARGYTPQDEPVMQINADKGGRCFGVSGSTARIDAQIQSGW